MEKLLSLYIQISIIHFTYVDVHVFSFTLRIIVIIF